MIVKIIKRQYTPWLVYIIGRNRFRRCKSTTDNLNWHMSNIMLASFQVTLHPSTA